MIMNIVSSDDKVYVFTMDSFVHIFDHTLKFIERKFIKHTATSAVILDDGNILSYGSDLTGRGNDSDMSYFSMQVNSPDFTSQSEVYDFKIARTFPHIGYGAGYLARQDNAVMVAFYGLNTIDVYDLKGKNLQSIILSEWNNVPKTIKIPMDNQSVERMKSIGFTDPTLMPDGNVVQYISGEGKYAVVLGGKYSPEPLQSVAVISQKFDVSYATLERKAEQVFVNNSQMYALEKDEKGQYAVAIYDLSAFQ